MITYRPFESEGGDFSTHYPLGPEAKAILARFRRPNVLPREHAEKIDFQRSLLVTRLVGDGTVTAALHPIPVPKLGIIHRPGKIAPYVQGPQLGLRQEIVYDPALQRTGSLPLTTEAAVQELATLSITERFPGEVLLEGWWTDDPPSDWTAGLKKRRERFVENVFSRLDPADSGYHLRAKVLGVELPGAFEADAELETEASLQEDWLHASRTFFDDQVTAGRKLVENYRRRHFNFLEGSVPTIVQGAGDLTFNEWNVAYFKVEGRPDCFIPEGEPISHRRYRCLVGSTEGRLPVAEPGVVTGGTLAMLELRFTRDSISLAASKRPHGEPDIADLADLAVYGKSIIWEGELLPKHEVVDQFRDLRHIFALPDLNTKKLRQQGRNRFFGRQTNDSVWLLEQALLEDPNLRRLACTAPIRVPLERLGAEADLVEAALTRQAYDERSGGASDVRRPGDWAWDGEVDKSLVIYLKPNGYPCSIIAVGSSRTAPLMSPGHGGRLTPALDSVYWFAWGHQFDRGRFRIWEDCGKLLLELGARYALVMDEGQDVFQWYSERSDSETPFAELEENQGDLSDFFTVNFARSGRTLKRTATRCSLRFTLSGDSNSSGPA